MNLENYDPIEEYEWETLKELFSEPVLRWSTSVLDDRTYERIPMLLDPKGRIVDAPTSWFLHLSVSNMRPLAIEKYAYAIRVFWAYLEKLQVRWTRTNDELLRKWRNSLEKDFKGSTVNQSIDTVVAFFVWAQEQGYASSIVGATPEGGQPFPVRLVTGKGRNKRLVSCVRAQASRPVRGPVPDIDDVDRLYERLTGPNEATSERNCRMADLAVEAGLRREELASLKKDAIPSYAVIAEHQAKNKVHKLTVIGKRGKQRIVPILPELMKRLQDYIHNGRKTLLGKTTRIEDHLFLSRKTGRRLTGPWISKIFTAAFGDSRAVKLTLHRLRARFASLVVLTLARREVKARGLKHIREDFVLRSAAEVLGHGDLETLRRYVDLSIKLLEKEAEGQVDVSDAVGVDERVLAEVHRQNRSVRDTSDQSTIRPTKPAGNKRRG